MSTSSGFSNFLPRFNKTKEGSLSPSKASGPPEDETGSRSRRSSFSLAGRRSPSPSLSPALSTKSSFSDFTLSRPQKDVSQSSGTTMRAKAPAPPPKLTLTDVGSSESSSIHIPSPISGPGEGHHQSFGLFASSSPTAYDFGGGMSGSLSGRSGGLSLSSVGGGVTGTQGWEDEDEIRTPTGTTDGLPPMGLSFGGLGEGSLTLEDATSAGGRTDSVSSSPGLPSASSPSTSSSARPGSFSAVPGSPPRPSTSSSSPYANGHAPSASSSSSQSSLTNLLTTDAPNKSKRRLSTSSRRSMTKPSGGIAAAIASMSKDLVNPAANMRPHLPPSQTSSSSSTPNGHPRATSPTPATNGTPSSYRRRAGTGSASIPSSVKSQKSESSSRKGRTVTRAATDAGGRTSIDDDMLPSRDSTESHGGGSEMGDYDDEDADEEGDEDDEDDDGLDDDLDDLPVTGFAVASAKRNNDFHLLFNEVPEVDYLIEDYGCALQRDILVQGRLYVSENHVCFHASIFGWVTNMVIPFSEILRIDKKMTAFVIPNAIMISTLRSKYTFASFLSRDTTYDVIHNIWRLSHPHLPSMSTDALTDGGHSTQTNSQGSVLGDDHHHHLEGSHSPRHLGVNIGGGGGGKKTQTLVARKPTTCACGTKGEHYAETALDAIFPSTPEKIYNLMFTSGFAKDFMSGNQKLMDIQTSDWAPETSGSNLLTRKMSYIKPLPGGFGPKQTKCELQDETVHVDFDDYVSMVTTTRTPDVPSGGSFSVKTRTCLMWAGGNSTRVLVTCQVDWTGRSFIKGIIDSSALSGQKSFHADQESAMRAYIADHLTEFHTEGLTSTDDEPSGDPTSPLAGPSSPSSPPEKHPSDHTGPLAPPSDAQLKATQDGWFFQYGVDTFCKGFVEIFKGLWAILESVGAGMTMKGFFVLLIVGLLVSNVWTLFSLKGVKSKERSRRAVAVAVGEERLAEARRAAGAGSMGGGGAGRGGESPDSVAEAVKSFLEDYITRQDLHHTTRSSSSPQPLLASDEIKAITSALDALEQRICGLRNQLPPLPLQQTSLSSPSLEELE